MSEIFALVSLLAGIVLTTNALADSLPQVAKV